MIFLFKNGDKCYYAGDESGEGIYVWVAEGHFMQGKIMNTLYLLFGEIKLYSSAISGKDTEFKYLITAERKDGRKISKRLAEDIVLAAYAADNALRACGAK